MWEIGYWKRISVLSGNTIECDAFSSEQEMVDFAVGLRDYPLSNYEEIILAIRTDYRYADRLRRKLSTLDYGGRTPSIRLYPKLERFEWLHSTSVEQALETFGAEDSVFTITKALGMKEHEFELLER